MRPTKGGLTYYSGGCHDCGASWGSRNVMGVAAQHAAKYGHETWADVGYSYLWEHSQ